MAAALRVWAWQEEDSEAADPTSLWMARWTGEGAGAGEGIPKLGPVGAVESEIRADQL